MSGSSEIDILEDLFILKYIYDVRKKRKRNRELFKSRARIGFYNTGVNILDPELFYKSLRMRYDQFKVLLALVSPMLQKFSNRKPIQPEQRLYITLYFLAHGCSLHTISMKFRIGLETARSIILDTCDVLWTELAQFYVKPPTEDDWRQVASDFHKETGLPNCIGAIDGKHLRIDALPNYKKFNSIVLLAVCDANYVFTLVDVGAYGSQSDGGVFKNSALGKKFLDKNLNIPPDEPLPGTDVLFPYYLVADAAFPLKPNIMKPFTRAIHSYRSQYNYSISRARARIEMAFGLLASKWRILRTSIHFAPKNARKIVLATVVLHNFLKLNAVANIELADEQSTLISISRVDLHSLNSSSQLAIANRNILCQYINSKSSI